jgi:hypothetical protein
MKIQELKNTNAIYSTSFHDDTIETTPKNLRLVLGEEPDDFGPGDKVSLQWTLQLEEPIQTPIPFTIYDWKERMPACDNPERLYRFHIGARNEAESRKVTKALKELLRVRILPKKVQGKGI